MSIPKYTMSRRTFLRSVLAQSAAMVVSSFQLSHPNRMRLRSCDFAIRRVWQRRVWSGPLWRSITPNLSSLAE